MGAIRNFDSEYQHSCGWPVRNLSGLNSNGSSHMRGSVWIFQRFVINRVPFGTWYPPIMQFSENTRGADNRPTGYKRHVSLTMAWR